MTEHDILSGHDEAQLNALINAADMDNCRLRIGIARNEQIKAMAQHRIIGLQLQEAERE